MLNSIKELKNYKIPKHHHEDVYQLTLAIRGHAKISGNSKPPGLYMPYFTAAAKGIYKVTEMVSKESRSMDMSYWMSRIFPPHTIEGIQPLDHYTDFAYELFYLWLGYAHRLGEMKYLDNRNWFIRWLYRKRIGELQAQEANWRSEMYQLADKYNIQQHLKGEYIGKKLY